MSASRSNGSRTRLNRAAEYDAEAQQGFDASYLPGMQTGTRAEDAQEGGMYGDRTMTTSDDLIREARGRARFFRRGTALEGNDGNKH